MVLGYFIFISKLVLLNPFLSSIFLTLRPQSRKKFKIQHFD